MYQIKIIDTTFGEVALDLQEPSFPYTFESSSVAELRDQSASWSYTIRLPRTSTNERILGTAGAPYVQSNVPYKRLLCNVYSDGIQIIRRGVMFIASTTDTDYEVQIVSGQADVFERMKDIPLAELSADWIGVQPMPPIAGHIQEGASPAWNWAYYYGLILSRDKRNDEVLYNNTEEGNLMPYYIPYVRFGGGGRTETEEEQGREPGGMLPYILRAIGVDIELDADVAHILDGLYITLSQKQRYGDAEPIWRSERYAIAKDDEEVQVIQTLLRNDSVRRYLRCEFRVSNTTYRDSQGNIIPMPRVLDSFYSVANDVRIYAYDSQGVEITHIVLAREDFDDRGRVNIDVELPSGCNEAGAKLIVSNRQWSYNDGQGSVYYTGLNLIGRVQEFVIYAPEQNEAFAGEKINILANVPFSTAEDVFKFVCQTFGLIVNVHDNTLQAHTYAYVYGRKDYSLDWTDKVAQHGSPTTEYQFGEYAQKNYISFKENPRDGYTDRSHFDIPNVNIAKSAEVLDVQCVSGHGLQIDAYDLDEDGLRYSPNISGSHLFYVAEGTAPVRYTTADILARYQELALTLEHSQVLRVPMVLTAQDIQAFDPYTPIYLRQYGAYFYVNKISQWEDGKIAEVELLRM